MDERTPPGDHRELAGKVSVGIMGHDQTFAFEVRLHNLQAPGQHYKKRHVTISQVKQDLADLDLTYSAMRKKTVDLCLCQGWERLSAGVESAGDADEQEVRTHEVPEDDVPDEYLDKE